MRTFGVAVRGRDNNFRLLAALAVLISHSFPLASGGAIAEPFANTGLSLGGFAVSMFFGMSGYLITKSFENAPNRMVFIEARLLRLLPALVVALVLTTLVVGPFFSNEPIGEYFSHRRLVRYVLVNGSLLGFQADLPGGVFAGNPYANVANGSLWTLRYELCCYAIVFALGSFKLLKPLRFAFVLIFYVIVQSWYRSSIGGLIPPANLVMLLPSFVTGMTLYVYRDRIPFSLFLAAPPALLAYGLRNHAVYFELICIAVVVATLAIAAGSSAVARAYDATGDFSYGIYIYAFLIQQMIVSLQPGIGILHLFLSSAVLTTIVAIGSWHLVERPALRLKNRLLQRKVSGHAGDVTARARYDERRSVIRIGDVPAEKLRRHE